MRQVCVGVRSHICLAWQLFLEPGIWGGFSKQNVNTGLLGILQKSTLWCLLFVLPLLLLLLSPSFPIIVTGCLCIEKERVVQHVFFDSARNLLFGRKSVCGSFNWSLMFQTLHPPTHPHVLSNLPSAVVRRPLLLHCFLSCAKELPFSDTFQPSCMFLLKASHFSRTFPGLMQPLW